MEKPLSITGKLIIILASLVGLALTIISINTSYNAYKTKSWPTTEGIISTSVVEGNYRYVPKVIYSYRIGDEELLSNKIRIKDMAQYKKKDDAAKVIEKYPFNQKCTVYYNPNNPSEAILEPGIMGEHVFMVLIGIVIFLAPLIGLIYSIRKAKTKVC